MNLRFFDANVSIGRPMNKAMYEPLADVKALLAHTKKTGVGKALVWHVAQHDGSPCEGNSMLANAIRGQRSLYGCWALLPPNVDDVITPDFFRRMQKSRIVALRVFPDMHRYLLNRVVFGRFLDEVTARRIPLLLSMEFAVTWPAVYALLKDYPSLTCIIADLGAWSVDRYTYPLLETYPGVHIESSFLACTDGGVERMVEKFGAGRIVFGTAMPRRYTESAMLQLVHAEISDTDKALIASGNLERLVAGVELS